MVEHLLEPAAAARRRARVPLRRELQAVPPRRARLRGRGDDVGRPARAPPGGARRGARAARRRRARALVRGLPRAPARLPRDVIRST